MRNRVQSRSATRNLSMRYCPLSVAAHPSMLCHGGRSLTSRYASGRGICRLPARRSSLTLARTSLSQSKPEHTSGTPSLQTSRKNRFRWLKYADDSNNSSGLINGQLSASKVSTCSEGEQLSLAHNTLQCAIGRLFHTSPNLEKYILKIFFKYPAPLPSTEMPRVRGFCSASLETSTNSTRSPCVSASRLYKSPADWQAEVVAQHASK